jgi:hypothetical protein
MRQLIVQSLLLLQAARVRRFQVTSGEIPATNPPIYNRKIYNLILVQL